MSEKEFNRRTARNRSARRAAALRAAAVVLVRALAVLGVFIALWAVHFINPAFLVLLTSGTIVLVAFRLGAIFGEVG